MKIPRISLEQWAAFKAVVDEGSFAKAAERLNKSQSSVSYIINNLQSQLPSPVLVLQGRKAELTEVGKVLYRHAKNLLESANTIEQIAKHQAMGWENEVTIAVDAIVDIDAILQVIAQFSNQYPQTRIRILETTLSSTEEAILEKQAEIVFAPLAPPGFLGTPIGKIEMIAVAHPNHELLKTDALISHTELKNHRQIVIRDTGIRRKQDAGWLGSEQRWTVTTPSTSIKAVKANVGFAFLPKSLVATELEEKTLVQLPLADDVKRVLPFYLIKTEPEFTGPATSKLIEFFKAIPPLI